jgi:hypothetical protein
MVALVQASTRIFNQDANTCVPHLGLLELSESTRLFHLLWPLACPSVTTTLWTIDRSTKLFKCDSLSPCFIGRYIIIRLPYVRPVHHYQYPSRVMCDTHVTKAMASCSLQAVASLSC